MSHIYFHMYIDRYSYQTPGACALFITIIPLTLTWMAPALGLPCRLRKGLRTSMPAAMLLCFCRIEFWGGGWGVWGVGG